MEMTIIEAARHRRSVRTFDGKPLKAEEIKKIKDFADSAANPFEIPIEWVMLDTEEYSLSTPVISGEKLYIAGKMKRVKNAEAAFGYTFEKIVLFAETLGIGTTWIAGTMKREIFEQAINLADGEVMPCISPLGRPAAKMSLRETVMRKGVKADTRLGFEELFYDSDFDTPLAEEKAGKLKTALELVRLAPSAVNKQPWRIVIKDGRAHFYEKKNKAHADADSWDVQKIDIGIALAHFEIGAAHEGITAEFEISDPGIPAAQGTQYMASFVLK